MNIDIDDCLDEASDEWLLKEIERRVAQDNKFKKQLIDLICDIGITEKDEPCKFPARSTRLYDIVNGKLRLIETK